MSETKVGSFTASGSTGNQAVTGIGFPPAAVLFLWAPGSSGNGYTDDWHLAIGAASSASDRWAVWGFIDDNATSHDGSVGTSLTNCLDSNGAGTADIVSLDSDGFTVNWSAAAGGSQVIGYMAFGAGIAAKAGSFTYPTSDSFSVTGVGFQPNMVYVAHADDWTDNPFAFGFGCASSLAVAGTQQACASYGQKWDSGGSVSRSRNYAVFNTLVTRCDMSGAGDVTTHNLTSYDSDGFTLTETGVAGNSPVSFTACYLALHIDGDPNTSGAQSEIAASTRSGLRNQGVGATAPRACVVLTNQHGANGTINALGKIALTLGLVDTSGNMFAVWSGHNDNVSPTNTAKHQSTSHILSYRTPPSTTDMEAAWVSWSGNNLQLDYTTSGGTDGVVDFFGMRMTELLPQIIRY